MHRCNEKGVSETNHNFGAIGKTEVVGALVSRVGDLLVSGYGAFIAYLSGDMGNGRGVKFPDGNVVELFRAYGLKRCLMNSLTMAIFPTDPKLLLARR